MKQTYTTTIVKGNDKDVAGLQVPTEIVEAFNSGKKPKVIIHIKDYSYRSTVAVMGGVYMLPLAKEHREKAGVKGGDTIEVTLELDTEPRTVEVPEALATALAEKVGAREAFDALAYSIRKEHVRNVNDAKTDDTRARRIAAIVAKM
jgi:hypothetical protein